MKKYGLLLSGGVNRKYNHKRYAHDLGLAYETLHQTFGLCYTDICVLYAEGEEINYLNHAISTRKASPENLRKAFSYYLKEITADDEFFFIVSNHGGEQDNGIIFLWNGEYISLGDITTFLSLLPCKKIVILGQCFAGNIFERHHKNTIMISANQKGLPSYAMCDTISHQKDGAVFKYDYDEFLYHFFSYFQSAYWNVENPADISDAIKVKHAFAYAYEKDRYNPSHADYDAFSERMGIRITEIPQYREYE